MPIGFINRLRRDAICQVERCNRLPANWAGRNNRSTCPLVTPRTWKSHRPRIETQSLSGSSFVSISRPRRRPAGNHSPELITLCRTFEQIEVALEEGIETIYVDFEDVRFYQQAVERIGERAHAFLATPRIQKSGEQGFFRLIENARPYGVLIRNLGSISFFREKRISIARRLFAEYCQSLDGKLFRRNEAFDQLTISYDLNIKEVLSLLRYEPASLFELTIHQHMPMFHMEHCVFAAFLSDGTDYTNCGRPCDRHDVKLRDRVAPNIWSKRMWAAETLCSTHEHNPALSMLRRCWQRDCGGSESSF